MGRSTSAKFRKQKVLIIGGGVAGMSCAATLAKEPDKFEVTLLERSAFAGGQAMSMDIDSQQYGADWMNIGTQGGNRMFRHTYKFFREYGYEPREVRVQFSFGKGTDGFWTNMFPTPMIQRHRDEIKKFGKTLKLIRHFPIPLWIVPLKKVLKMFGFSTEFAHGILYPTTSLLLGVGNEPEDIPCGILQQLFEHPQLKLWDYDTSDFMPPRPVMFAFPNLSRFYADWTAGLREKGIMIRLNTQALRIIQRDNHGIIVETRHIDEDSRLTEEAYRERLITEEFDKLVLCVPGDEARRLLGDRATWKEKVILNGVKYHDDVTITHSDHNYVENKYEPAFKQELCGTPHTKAQEEQIAFSRGEAGIQSGFHPSYYSISYPTMPTRNELTFDYSNFQYQFQQGSGEPPVPFERHIFQTRFMGAKLKDIWTIDSIAEKEVIQRRWIHQPSQGWKNFFRVMPYLRYINGKNNTLFAGAWAFAVCVPFVHSNTEHHIDIVQNMYEAASISGIAAAVRLGVPYESIDDFADKYFGYYMQVAYGQRVKKTKTKA
ncbi:hypothetical protein LOZ65_004634 [Ophidiomyces ophidiicola]|nr:hypothetical protein LOZ65_004634 [Ophidiomyces ophidiicola]